MGIRLIVTVVIVSLFFGCGPSELEQTVAEGKRKLEEQQERDRIKAEIKSDVAEKRYQQTLIEIERQRAAAAEQARLQAEYDYKKSVLDAENRKLELQNQLRKVEIESDKEIRITEMKSQAEIKRHQIQAYERITTERINAQASVEETKLLSMANVEESKLLSKVGVEKAKMQALIGAVQMRLDSQTQSDKIEAAKQIEIAKTIASVEIARVEGTARIETEAAIAIVDRISRAKTEQELIEYAATVALFSQQGQPINSQLNRYDNY